MTRLIAFEAFRMAFSCFLLFFSFGHCFLFFRFFFTSSHQRGAIPGKYDFLLSSYFFYLGPRLCNLHLQVDLEREVLCFANLRGHTGFFSF
jgi:hypothetical protein